MLAIFGFDVTNVPLTRRLMEEGRLPALSSLAARGRWLDLDEPVPYFGARHKLHTGVGVPEHGLYYPFMWSAAEQRLRYAWTFPEPPTIWDRLTAAGRRSLVVDAYESRPPASMAGVCLSGWQSRNSIVLRRWSRPNGRYRAFASRHGRAPVVEEVFGRRSKAQLLETRERLLGAPARAATLATELLERESFDLVWITFGAPHQIGHELWDLSQLPSHDNLSDEESRLLGNAMGDVYAATDRALGAVVERLPDDADVMVVSPSGMDVNTSRSDLLPGMLAAVLEGRRQEPTERKQGALWKLRALVPTSWRARITQALPDELAIGITTRLETRGIDFSRTRAFALPGSHQGYVRLNLKGRERDGIVDSAAVDEIVEELRAGLTTFADDDGRPSVEHVDRTRDLVGEGARGDQLPDVVVRWAETPTTALRGVHSPEFGSVVREGVGTGRAGNHCGGAWALVAPGASRLAGLSRAPNLLDIGATAVSVAGADGGSLEGLPLLEPSS